MNSGDDGRRAVRSGEHDRFGSSVIFRPHRKEDGHAVGERQRHALRGPLRRVQDLSDTIAEAIAEGVVPSCITRPGR